MTNEAATTFVAQHIATGMAPRELDNKSKILPTLQDFHKKDSCRIVL